MSKGVVHLLLLLIFAVAAMGLVIYILLTSSIIPKRQTQIGSPKKEVSVELKKEYQNPFDKKTQYTNPFSSYKNPFDNLE